MPSPAFAPPALASPVLAFVALLANRFFLLGLLSISAANICLAADAIEIPEGATAIFNGDDLHDWHGMAHFSPYDLRAMSEEDRAAKRATRMVNW